MPCLGLGLACAGARIAKELLGVGLITLEPADRNLKEVGGVETVITDLVLQTGEQWLQ